MTIQSDVFTSAGTLYATFAGQPATYDQAGFEALAWVNVAEVTDIPEFGAVFERVDHQPLATRNTVKRKGTKDDGSLTVVLGRDPSDAGQNLLREGNDGTNVDTVYSHRVTLQDGTVFYFTSQIFSYTTNVGAANNIVGANVQLEINDKIIEINP